MQDPAKKLPNSHYWRTLPSGFQRFERLIMRTSTLRVLLFLVAVAAALMVIINLYGGGSSDAMATQIGRKLKVEERSGKLMGVEISVKMQEMRRNMMKARAGVVSLEDYRAVDPVPSARASIKHGPIEHGSPTMPYIPKPSPPPGSVRPKRGGSP